MFSRGEDRFLWSRKNSPFEGGKRVLKINECDCRRAAPRLASGGKGRGTGEDLRCRPRGRNREGDNLVEEVIRGRACPDEVRIGVGSRERRSKIRGRRHQPRRHLRRSRKWSRGGPATIFAGNMIEMDDDGDITSYTYDRENRLIEAELPDSTTIEYEYGPNGDRFKRYDGTDTIYYVYDGEDVLMELDGSGTVEARYTHVSGGFSVDYPLMMRRGGENYFYMKDKLGSVVGLLDDEENVEVAYEYDAWGTIVAEVGSLWNPYRFTAREWDPDTGLYYYRARTYKPETGRFMQIDHMGMVDGTDMFVYVGNDPVNGVDPFGLLTEQQKKAYQYYATRRDPHLPVSSSGREYHFSKYGFAAGWKKGEKEHMMDSLDLAYDKVNVNCKQVAIDYEFSEKVCSKVKYGITQKTWYRKKSTTVGGEYRPSLNRLYIKSAALEKNERGDGWRICEDTIAFIIVHECLHYADDVLKMVGMKYKWSENWVNYYTCLIMGNNEGSCSAEYLGI